jgi:hypothetical protein
MKNRRNIILFTSALALMSVIFYSTQVAARQYELLKTQPYTQAGGNGALVAGGMTRAQAEALMSEYKSPPTDWPNGTYGGGYNVYDAGCIGGAKANCVAFSEYFVNRYIDVPDWTDTVDGRNVVNKLHTKYGWATGDQPRPYAIFSTNSGNHTGVVLGVNSDGTYITGEASCGDPLSWAGVKSHGPGYAHFVYPPEDKLTLN